MPTEVELYLKQTVGTDRKIVDVIGVRQAATLLGIKVYQARTLEWDGAFGDPDSHRRPGRKGVSISKRVVLQYKQDNPNIGQGEQRSRVVSDAEVGQDVIHSCEVVSKLFHSSEAAKDVEFTKKLDSGLARFTKQGESLAYK